MVASFPASGDTQLLSPDAEARVFLRLRTTLAWQTVRWMCQHARLRLSLVTLLSAVFWASLYGIFYEAFTFVDSLHADVISLLFNAFFASLMVMLVFSTGILTYGSMYTSTQAKLLLTLPARSESIFGHMFRESLWFSSWGFVLLGSPMLVAYGVIREASWTYYVLLLPFMISFVVIPATVGSICCVAMAAWLPRMRMYAFVILLAACGSTAIWLGWSLIRSVGTEGLTATWLEKTLSNLALTEHKLLPSWWLSSGLIEAARKGSDAANAWASLLESLKFLALLVSNGLLVQVIGLWMARVAYRLGYSEVTGEVSVRRNRPLSRFDDFLMNIGSRRRRPVRLLLVKDLRVFRRDIAQWSQVAIFFGLLALYFLNLSHFNYNMTYRSLIGFLNLAVVGLILSTFTTRFVFPMISLEGRRFWILGLLPVHRDQIVWSKFLFSFIGGVVPCSLLLLMSDLMLDISMTLIVVHEICCLILCMGLSGIAVGLGAMMPDLQETSPAKIASGFGGTLSLVVSSLFIIFTVTVVALPIHVFTTLAAMAPPGLSPFRWAAGPWGMATAVGVIVAVGLLVTFIPLVLGLRAFRQLEA